jgi:pimeloyl-ACP methyl ester carboxylesterase
LGEIKLKSVKWIKTAIEVVGFPFTLTNIYLNKRRNLKEIGQKIKIQDRYIHTIVSDKVETDYTVILDAGISCCSLDWHYIQPQVSKFARVISFDRAGYGWSSVSHEPYTSENVVNDLMVYQSNQMEYQNLLEEKRQ